MIIIEKSTLCVYDTCETPIEHERKRTSPIPPAYPVAQGFVLLESLDPWNSMTMAELTTSEFGQWGTFLKDKIRRPWKHICHLLFVQNFLNSFKFSFLACSFPSYFVETLPEVKSTMGGGTWKTNQPNGSRVKLVVTFPKTHLAPRRPFFLKGKFQGG